jgi:hypothetical protein
MDVQIYNYNVSLTGRTQLIKVLNLEVGDQVKITASGQVNYTEDGAGASPAGDRSLSKDKNLSCYSATPLSLYGKLGGISNDCFEVGQSYEFVSFSRSAFLLGVNDIEGAFKDNTGYWNVIIDVVRLSNSSYGAPDARSFVIPGDTSWKDVKLSVSAGDVLLIRADGTVLCAPECTPSSAEGNDISPSSGRWPCPAAKAMSLIARIGDGACFKAVTKNFIDATNAGNLFFGVNDDYLEGNIGKYTAHVLLYKRIPDQNKVSTFNLSIGNKSKSVNATPLNLNINNSTESPLILNDTNTSSVEVDTPLEESIIEPTDKVTQEVITPAENISKDENAAQQTDSEIYVKAGIILAVLLFAFLYSKLRSGKKKHDV